MQSYLVILIIGLSAKSIQCVELPQLGPYNTKARIVLTTSNDTNHNNMSFRKNLLLRHSETTRQLIIGAPTSGEYGQFYMCEFTGPEIALIENVREQACNLIDFEIDDKIGKVRDHNEILQNADKMLLGASMAGTDSSENPFVICAPHWKRLSWQWEPSTNGICYVLADFKKKTYNRAVIPYSELNSTSINKIQLQNIEAGWSSHVVPDAPESLIIGAPEYHKGKGIAFYYKNTTETPGHLECYICEEGKISHFGYSIASGIFNSSESAEIYFAISAPKANETGIVLFFGRSGLFENISYIEGQIPGELFGYSLAAIRLYRDDQTTSDLAVGAPSAPNSTSDGRVYLYTTSSEIPRLLHHVATLEDRKEPRSMFGAAVVDLGDLDDDSVPEIGVGAPNAADGKGAFYVFKKSNDGNYVCLQKVIFEGFMGFGNSLASIPSGEKPCQDVAVGSLSYKSVLLPCHIWTSFVPSITAMAEHVNSTHLQFVATFFLTSFLWTRKFSVFTDLKIMVVAKYKDEFIDIESEDSGMYENTAIIEHLSDESVDFSFNLTFVPKKKEYTGPLYITMKFEMNEDPSGRRSYKREYARADPDKRTIPVLLGCKEDICEPNLTFTLKKPERNQENVRGSGTTSEKGLLLVARVHNSGDAAYNTSLHVEVPYGLKLTKPERCHFVHRMLECKLKNPVWSNEEQNIDLQFHIVSSDWRSSLIEVNVNCPSCRAGANKKLRQKFELHAHRPKMTLEMYHAHSRIDSNNVCRVVLEQHDLSSKKLFLMYNYKIINSDSTPWTGLHLNFSIVNKHAFLISESSRIQSQIQQMHGREFCKESDEKENLNSSLARICQFNLKAYETIEINFTVSVKPDNLNKIIQDVYLEILAKAHLGVPNFQMTSSDTMPSLCWLHIDSKDATPQMASSTVFGVAFTILLIILSLFIFAIRWKLCKQSLRSNFGTSMESLNRISIGCEAEEKYFPWNGEKAEKKYTYHRDYSYTNEMLEQYPEDKSDTEEDEPKNIDGLLVDMSIDSDGDEISEQLQEQVPLSASNLGTSPKFNYY